MMNLKAVRKRHKKCKGLARCRVSCDIIQLADEVELLMKALEFYANRCARADPYYPDNCKIAREAPKVETQ